MPDETTTPGRTTLLEGVNTLLDCIGEQPVNTLSGQQIGEAQRAKSVLLEFHRSGQTRGWAFNSEADYPLPRSQAGEIVIPDNVASFNPAQLEWNHRFVFRGSRVYDVQNHTFAISPDIKEIRGTIIWYLSWSECPEVYNRWIVCYGARVFVSRALGDEGQARLQGLDEGRAFVDLQDWQLNAAKPNSLFAGGRGVPFPAFSPATSFGMRHSPEFAP